MMERIGEKIDKSLGGGLTMKHVVFFISSIGFMSACYSLYKSGTEQEDEYQAYYDADDTRKAGMNKIVKISKQVEDLETKISKLKKTRQITQLESDLEKSKQELEAYQKRLQELELPEEMGENMNEVNTSLEDSRVQNVEVKGAFNPKVRPGDEKKNVWVTDEVTPTVFDFREDRINNVEAFEKSINRSCVMIYIRHDIRGEKKLYEGRGIILSNDCILVNSHGVPNVAFTVKLVSHVYYGFLASQLEFVVQPSQVERVSQRDLVIIHTKSLPQLVSNFSRNIIKASFNGKFDGFYAIKMSNGSVAKHPVYSVTKTHLIRKIGDFYFSCTVFVGHVTEPTRDGHCGSPLILETGYGPAVVGFHFIFSECSMKVYASALFQEDLELYTPGVQGSCVDLEPYSQIQPKYGHLSFHDQGSIVYLGEINYHVRYKTRVVKSEIYEQVKDQEVCGFKFEDTFGKPVMHKWIPQQVNLAGYLQPSFGLNEERLARCSKVLVEHIVSSLGDEIHLIHKYPYEVALNGFPGMAYVDSMKRNTSMGFPWHTTKRKYLKPHVTTLWPEGVVFDDVISDRISDILHRYERGERVHPVFTANLKDEVLSLKKIEAGKTRTMFSCPADYLVAMRILFSGLNRVVQRNWKKFHCVIGVNCHSNQWQEVFEYLTQFGEDRIIAGDFGWFDKSFAMCFSRWVTKSIVDIMMASGNFEGERIMLEAACADFVNPTVNWFGTVIMLTNGEVSGHPLTTIFNCFCSIMYLMYSYDVIYEDCCDYFDHVSLLVLGDDNISGSSQNRPLYNHTNIQMVLNSIGVGYTMAEKEAKSIPFISIYEATFLKRTFRYDPRVAMHVGPLEKKSLIKMLLWKVKTKGCSSSDQLAQCLVSASMEAFYHGKEFSSAFDQMLDQLILNDACRIAVKLFPRFTEKENVNRFLGSGNSAEDNGRNQNCTACDSNCDDCSHFSLQSLRMDSCCKSTRAFPKIPIQESRRLDCMSENTGSKYRSRDFPDNNRSMNIEELNAQQSTKTDTEGSVVEKQELTHFAHEGAGEVTDLSTLMDPIADRSLISSTIASFFKRPVKIWNYEWDIGASSGVLDTFFPWKLFFNTTPMKNKLETFAYVRGNLKLKFVINASPFYYGSIGAFYFPLGGNFSDERRGENYGSLTGTQILISQRNHVWLDPQSTTNAEMTLPFLSPVNFIDTSAATNFESFGTVDLVQFADLRSANGVAAGSVIINAWAWMEDIEFAGATTSEVLQGKFEPNGQISEAASTVGSVARTLKDVPFLGPFATATESASAVVGKVASFFGYTNTPIIEDIRPYKPLAFAHLASSEISEPVQKLSLQPKAETSVGQYFGDPGEDSLLISNFCARESFLGATEWSTTLTENTSLFTSDVSPSLYHYQVTTQAPQGSWWHVPMSYISTFFQYWRGDIIFRFKVVRSKYHRGRLQVAWDVGQNNLNATFTVGDPSIMNVIMDLDEEDEVEVRVPYTQMYPYLLTDTDQTTNPWSPDSSPSSRACIGNGILKVSVVNPLTAPVASSSVLILCFVRAAENIKFAAPLNMRRDRTLMALQGKTITFNSGGGDDDSNTETEVFGEHIASLRQLMHRQARVVRQVINKGLDYDGDIQTWVLPFQRIPRVYGYHPAAYTWEEGQGVITTGSYFDFNYVNNVLPVWIAQCYIGMRGSVNYTFNLTSSLINADGSSPIGHSEVVRQTRSYTYYPTCYATNPTTNSYSQYMKNLNTGNVVGVASGMSGMAITNAGTQNGLSVNLPYYCNQKFIPMDLYNWYRSDPQGYYKDPFEKDWWRYSLTRSIESGTPDGRIFLDVYYGTGPDFDLVYFLNVPPVLKLDPPTAKA